MYKDFFLNINVSYLYPIFHVSISELGKPQKKSLFLMMILNDDFFFGVPLTNNPFLAIELNRLIIVISRCHGARHLDRPPLFY